MWAARRCRFRCAKSAILRSILDELESLITDRTRLIILNSPQNPTGGVLPRSDIEKIAEAVGERNIMVLSDEIYSRLQFEGEPFSIMSRAVDAGSDDSAGWFLKDLRDDRLAHGLRRDACGPCRAVHAPDDQFELLHGELYADGGN